MSLGRLLTVAALLGLSGTAYGAENPAYDPEMEAILSSDISDLVVTSASKREQKLTDVPAAIYVITQEDLHRSGVNNIPDALRMVPGMEVAQASSHAWAVSARGFNAVLDNKLLVLIDGRTVYTPVFSGVYWDDAAVPIEDIERIEVIRGPGASLWGANAVDGVINIVTKNASDTQGNYVTAGVGNQDNFVQGWHGGKLDDNSYYRTYGQYDHEGPTENPSGGNNPDSWYRARSGFRMDSTAPDGDLYNVQGDVYGGKQFTQTTWPTNTTPFSMTEITDDSSFGGNILGHWTHQVSPDSSIGVQAYIDNYSREEANADQHVNTADLEFQNNIKLDDRNNFIWGAGSRFTMEDILGSFETQVNDQYNNHYILNTFAQDEYALIPKDLYLTLGSKLEYNDYTQFEIEPSGRLAWHPSDNQTVWGAVSRAVRTPSDVEEDIIDVLGTFPHAPHPIAIAIVGDDDQKSEKLTAYELGYRIQPTHKLSFDTSLYYNQFSDLETVGNEKVIDTLRDGTELEGIPFDNLGSGHVYGGEESVNWNVTNAWRLMGGYTYSKMDLFVQPLAIANLNSTERLDPRNQFSVRSYWNVTDTIQWDNMLYYVSNITAPAKSYTRYDTRIGWQVLPDIELSLTGQNLFDHEHVEFPGIPQSEIPQSFIGRIAWKF